MASIDSIVRRWASRSDGDGSTANSVFVVGLGRFGTAVASELVDLEVEVLAIDSDQRLVDEWADKLDHVRLADGTDINTLKQLGATDFDTAVVAIGSGIEASILSTSALVDLGVRNVWAKAITEEHGRILQRIGAHHVVFPEREMGERVAHVVTGHVTDYFELDENFALAELDVPDALAGVRLNESGIRDRFGITVVCIKPIGHAFTYATNETILGAGDVVLIAGETDAIETFAEFASK